MHELQKTGTYCDVVLKGSEEASVGIPCHRIVLTVHSEYFRAAFTQEWKESTQQVYQLRNIDSQTLNELVEYAYTLNISLNGDNVEHILIAAQFLQIATVVRFCWDYVEKHLHLSNCLLVHALASNYHNPNVADAALGFIRRHFLEFVEGHDFLQMDAQQLILVIGSDVLDVPSEDQVFQAVMRWWEYDRPGRLAHLQSLLQTVRVPFLTSHVMTVQRNSRYTDLCNEWRRLASMQKGHHSQAFATLNDHIYAVGGYDLGGAFNQPLPSVEAYDATDDSWSAVASLPARRASMALVACAGRLYAFGGENGARECKAAFCYDPSTNSWSRLASMPIARSQCAACVGPSGLIYVVGGIGQGRDHCVEAYDRATNQWIRKGDLVHPRSQPGCACVDGKLYVLGGHHHEEVNSHDSIEVYDEDADRWALHECRLPQARYAFGCLVMKMKRE
ncbi:kelch-like protein 3 [Paramacrobiotus metropolitanus]|uniref:kelch-like protein 3 n=1 Tax=Paramacrobiotus metropolitanus TaxID=2943436 RepID=UPI00244641C5|nr:kelch-like protein 3 [Paramacrobiotus metropolitanus]